MIAQFFDGLQDKSYTVFSLYHAESGQVMPISSRKLWTECRRWQLLLAERPEPVVAVFGHMTQSMIAAWLGAILAGKQPAFLSYPSHKIQPSDYERKMANYVARFGACVFVGEQVDREICATLLAPSDLPDLPEVEDEAGGGAPYVQAISPQERLARPLFLQCGSGTTGLQKAVAVFVNHLETQVQLYRQAIALDPGKDTIVSWLPLYHDMGLVAAFLLPLLTRTPFILIDTFEWAANPDLLLRLIASQRATLCWLPNFAFALLGKNRSQHDLRSMRAFINCSEPVSSAAMHSFLQAHEVTAQQLGVCYALAENVFAVSQTPLGEVPSALWVDRISLQRRQVAVRGHWRLGEAEMSQQEEVLLFSCGPLLPDVKLRITAHKTQQVGDIWIAGPCAVPCFSAENHGPSHTPSYRSPSSLSHSDDWIATGDLGFMYEGRLYLCGRSKDLIIHNGKNIYPQDLEEVVNRHPEVYPGRVCALGQMDQALASEKVWILFESRSFLPVDDRPSVCAAMAREVDLLFDLRSQVVNVPRLWLQKTSSGKMARRAVLERFLSSQENSVHVCGDSHVRIFWTGDTSHQNIYQHIKAYWLGVLWADNWKQSVPFFVDLVARIHPKDALVIQVGEPECRTLFSSAEDPLMRIELSINAYRAFFLLLRKMWHGRLAYMTGIPTQPLNLDNGDAQWPICGDPVSRYRYQALFYQRMRTLCTELIIHFIDVCSPLLEADGFMDPQRLTDKTHLTSQHRDLYLERFENTYGHLDYSLNQEDVLEDGSWDGTYDHYRQLLEKKVRTLAMGQEPDWDHLISLGILDSLAVVELIAMLNRVCGFAIQPASVRREDFESVTGIYRKFAPKTAQSRD